MVHVHFKGIYLRACFACRGERGRWNELCGGCGEWVLFAEGGGNRWVLCNWAAYDGTTRPYIGRPSFAAVHRDLTDVAASEHFTLPGEPDALALQLLRETEPKLNVTVDDEGDEYGGMFGLDDIKKVGPGKYGPPSDIWCQWMRDADAPKRAKAIRDRVIGAHRMQLSEMRAILAVREQHKVTRGVDGLRADIAAAEAKLRALEAG